MQVSEVALGRLKSAFFANIRAVSGSGVPASVLWRALVDQPKSPVVFEIRGHFNDNPFHESVEHRL
jgi:hypothetical protein